MEVVEEEDGGGTRRSDGKGRQSSTLPCGCALPHVADAAFERLGGVPEGAHATVPVAVVGRLLGLSFWPLDWIEKKKWTK